MLTTQEPTYVSVGRAARHFGVTPVTIRRWMNSGRIAGIRTLGGHRRVLLPPVS